MLRSALMAVCLACCSAAALVAAPPPPPVVDIASTGASAGSPVTVGVTVSDDVSNSAIFGYNLDFVITPQAGSTGTLLFQTPSFADASPAFFPGSPPPSLGPANDGTIPTPNAYTTAFTFGGVSSPLTNAGLMELLLTASPNASGVFNVSVFQSIGNVYDGALLDSNGSPIVTQFVSGNVTISVPEPGSLMLALTGLAGLAAYLGFRRRSAA